MKGEKEEKRKEETKSRKSEIWIREGHNSQKLLWQRPVIVSQYLFSSSFLLVLEHTHHYYLLLAGNIIVYPLLYFPDSFAACCDHMTKLQPIGCERKWCKQFQVIPLLRKLLPLPTYDPTITSSGWDKDIVVVIQLLLCIWGSHSRKIRGK